MAKYLFVIEDQGSYNKITDVTVKQEGFEVDEELYKETTSIELWQFVQELLTNNDVKYDSSITEELTKVDIIQTSYGPLKVDQLHAIADAKRKLLMRVNPVSIYKFVKLMLLNNQLADAGYFITDENREEKYLDIVNTGEATLISLLESYLEIRDSIKQETYWYEQYILHEEAINNAETLEEIDSIQLTYNSLYL